MADDVLNSTLTEGEKLLITKVTLMGAVIEEHSYGCNLIIFKCSGRGREIWGVTEVEAAQHWLQLLKFSTDY